MKWPASGERRRVDRTEMDTISATTQRLADLLEPMQDALDNLASALAPLAELIESDDDE